MRPAILGIFALGWMATAALAQTTSSTSSASGVTARSTTLSGSSAVGRGAPALMPRPSGPVTPNRSSTDIFPPSRVLPPTEGAVSTQSPGSTGTTPTTGTSSTGQATPGGAAATTTDPSTSEAQGNATTNGTTTATTTDGQSSGSTGATRPIPPNSQTSSGSSQPVSTRTGKNALNETATDCMKIWEPAHHMTRVEWSRTCRRVEGRVEKLTKEVLKGG
jgi:hypothetical protein